MAGWQSTRWSSDPAPTGWPRPSSWPGPVSNWLASFFEDGLAVGVLWLATQYPVTFGIVLAVMVVLSVLLLIVLWKFLRLVIRKLKDFFGTGEPAPSRA